MHAATNVLCLSPPIYETNIIFAVKVFAPKPTSKLMMMI